MSRSSVARVLPVIRRTVDHTNAAVIPAPLARTRYGLINPLSPAATAAYRVANTPTPPNMNGKTNAARRSTVTSTRVSAPSPWADTKTWGVPLVDHETPEELASPTPWVCIVRRTELRIRWARSLVSSPGRSKSRPTRKAPPVTRRRTVGGSSTGIRRAARAIKSGSSPASAAIDVISLRVSPSSMRLTSFGEPASSAAFDRISENSLSVYLFEASLKGDLHADREDALASTNGDWTAGFSFASRASPRRDEYSGAPGRRTAMSPSG